MPFSVSSSFAFSLANLHNWRLLHGHVGRVHFGRRGGGNLHLGTLWRWCVVLVTFSAREKCVRWLYSTACILLPANIRVTFSATRDRSLWARQLRARGRRRPQLTRRLQEAPRSQAPTGPQRTWCLLRWVSWLRPLRSLNRLVGGKV